MRTAAVRSAPYSYYMRSFGMHFTRKTSQLLSLSLVALALQSSRPRSTGPQPCCRILSRYPESPSLFDLCPSLRPPQLSGCLNCAGRTLARSEVFGMFRSRAPLSRTSGTQHPSLSCSLQSPSVPRFVRPLLAWCDLSSSGWSFSSGVMVRRTFSCYDTVSSLSVQS
jgi:hypothetical protein